MPTFNVDTVTNQPSANIDHAKPIALIQCIKLDRPHIVEDYPAALRMPDYEENIGHLYQLHLGIARRSQIGWDGKGIGKKRLFQCVL